MVLEVRQSDFVTSVGWLEQLPHEDFPEVAFAGRSNVGKSSLINRLMGRKSLAQTSNTPGKTRTLNFNLINRNLHFVDLPGYGFALAAPEAVEAWQATMRAYLGGRGASPPRVLVCARRRGASGGARASSRG